MKMTEVKKVSNSNSLTNEKEYNPFEHRHVEHPNTFVGALTHLLKGSLGSGILAIPSAIAATGIVIGAVGTLLTGILCTYTVYLLVNTSQKICRKARVPQLGFSETAYTICLYGPKGIQRWANSFATFVDVALLLTYYTTIAVYVVFVSTSIQAMVNHYHPEVDDWPVQYYMLMIFVPLTVCCQVRQLKHLVPFSMIANTTMIVAFVITLYYMFSGIGDINIEDRKLFKEVSGIPLFFSTVLFAMEGIGTVIPVENSMIKPQQFLGCPGVLNIAMGTVVSLYVLIGLFGYIRFGDHVQANVIGDLPNAEIAAQVAKMCISVTVFLTSTLQFFVPCMITWKKLSPMVPEKHHNLAQIIFRTILVVIITAIAAAVPKLNAIISLVGSLFLSNLGLFVPVAFDTIYILGDDGNFGFLKWKLWKNILIGILAQFGMVSGCYYAFKELIED